MGWLTSIIEIVKSFLGWQEKREANFDQRKLDELDHEIEQLHNDIRAAADARNVRMLNEARARLRAANLRREALRHA